MILVVGLSPAWQRTLLLHTLHPGQVNRVQHVQHSAGGKAVHVAWALHQLQAPHHLLTFGAGGAEAEAFRAALDHRNVSYTWVPRTASLRMCFTLIDQQHATITELVEPSAPLHPMDEQAFFHAYQQLTISLPALVVLSGSIPKGATPNLFGQLVAAAPQRVIVDASGAALWSALSAKPWFVKPNRQELAETLGCSITTEAELLAAVRQLHAAGAQWVAITDGPGPVLLSGEGTTHWLQPTQVAASQPIYPIGAGDCFAAGLAWATSQGLSPPEATKVAVRVATASLLTATPAELDQVRLGQIVGDIGANGDSSRS